MGRVLVTDTYLEDIGDAIRDKLEVETTWKPSEMANAIESIETYPEPTGTKTITENGTGIDVKDYASADVNVPNTYTASDEGKVVDEGELVAQGSLTITENDTYDTTLISELIANIAGGGGGSVNILSGTDAPTSSVGSDGAIYLQYVGVPSGYTRLEYLESTGTQNIDTGIANSSTAYFEIECEGGTATGNNAIFGAAAANPNAEFVINYWNGWFFCAGSTHAGIDGLRHVYSAKSDGLYYDGIKITPNVNWANVLGVNYQMFAMNYGGTLYKSTGAKIYDCKIYDGSTIVRHFIPAKDSNDVLGMYDIVNDVFYTNEGTGTFIAGSELTLDDPISATYLKVNGAWQNLIGSDIDDVDTGGGNS